MTQSRFLIRARGGEVIASARDKFKQLDGTLISAADLTLEHTLPGLGRIVALLPIGAPVAREVGR